MIIDHLINSPMKTPYKLPKVPPADFLEARNKHEYAYLKKQGWRPAKKRGKNLLLKKTKEAWSLFEEETGVFFKSALQFELVERGKYLGRNQIDVLAGIGDVLLVIECKTKKQPGFRNIHSYITHFAGKRRSIEKAIKNRFGSRYKKIRYILALNDIDYSEADEEFARDSDVNIWGEKYLKVLKDLFTVLGPESRYYFFKELGIPKSKILIEGRTPYFRVPALRLTRGGVRIYSFIISAEKLLKLCYVARLESGRPEMYQRIVSRARLGEISDFINEGHTFKNNVIVSFEELPPRPSVIESGAASSDEETVDIVRLRIPKIYMSLWVIDGQHRLYGFARTPDAAAQRHILVTAIEDIDKSEQARTFVDINQNQKPVDSNLLWDLFDRLRPNTEWGAISQIVKKLSLEKTSVFRGKIYSPGLSKRPRKSYSIFFSNFCKGLLDRNIVDVKGDASLYGLMGGYGPDGIAYAATTIERYFRMLRRIAERSRKSRWINDFIFTNNGLNIFLRLFSHCIAYSGGKIDIKNLEKTLSSPLKRLFIERHQKIDDYRKRASSEGTREEIAGDFILAINAAKPDFARRYAAGKRKDILQTDIYKTYEQLERALRKFTERKLKRVSKNWWKERLDEDARSRAEDGYKKGEGANPFIAAKPRKLVDCLDFMDYPRIFIRKDNWSEVFKAVFKHEDLVTAAFREMKPIRNKIAHPADLSEEEKEEFQRTARKILRAISRR